MSAPLIRTGLVAVAVASGLLAVAPEAAPAALPVAAARADVAITHKLAKDDKKLLGKVKSSRESCTVARRVKLFWLEPGYDDYLFLTGVKTDANGKWKITHPERLDIPEGKYFARVGRTDDCSSAKSRVVTVG